MWLEETQYLVSYNFTERNDLEFRTRADQIVIRVYLSDFDLTIAIKVLPSQTTVDLKAIINFQLNNRSLPIKENVIYGLFIPVTNQWMQDDCSIEYYAALMQKIGVKVNFILTF